MILIIQKVFSFFQERIPERWLHAIGVFFTGLTFVDFAGLLWKCITGTITLFFAYLAWTRHKATMEIKNLEKEKLQQELGDLILSNKNKYSPNNNLNGK